jgi:hypothetical protein
MLYSKLLLKFSAYRNELSIAIRYCTVFLSLACALGNCDQVQVQRAVKIMHNGGSNSSSDEGDVCVHNNEGEKERERERENKNQLLVGVHNYYNENTFSFIGT